MSRWLRLAIGAAIVLVGWVFIAWQNKFHISPPLVFVCLGFLAVVLMIYNLWRTGAAVAMIDDEESMASWAKPVGPRTHLEREKKMLLKAIKEAEFDHQMGKLSKADADHMVAVYRARAIELIKALERDAPGLSVREKIEREVRARLEVDAKPKKKAESDVAAVEQKKQKKAKAVEAKAEAKAEKAEAKAAEAEAKIEAKAEAKAAEAEAKAEKADAKAAETDAKAEKADANAAEAKIEAKAAEAEAKAEITKSDAIVAEPPLPMPAKEATS